MSKANAAVASIRREPSTRRPDRTLDFLYLLSSSCEVEEDVGEGDNGEDDRGDDFMFVHGLVSSCLSCLCEWVLIVGKDATKNSILFYFLFRGHLFYDCLTRM